MKLFDKYSGADRYTRKSIDFDGLHFEVSDCLSFVCQCREIFLDEIYRFHSATASPLILDCGAKVGVGSLYFRKLYPDCRIKAFEADPSIAKLLRTNLDNNGAGDVEVISKAVWINDNGVEFSQDGADGGSVLGDTNLIHIDTVRLKQYLDAGEPIALLKLDIEGAEVDVLNDCRESLALVQNLYVEYHSWNSQPQRLHQLLEILTDNGFRYYTSTLNYRKTPFINTGQEANMDIPNVFGYRLS